MFEQFEHFHVGSKYYQCSAVAELMIFESVTATNVRKVCVLWNTHAISYNIQSHIIKYMCRIIKYWILEIKPVLKSHIH